MPARRATSVCLPVGARWVVELRRYSARTPILSVQRAWRGLPPLAEGHGPAGMRQFMTGYPQATGPADRTCQEVAS
jgi:hypothetical protein